VQTDVFEHNQNITSTILRKDARFITMMSETHRVNDRQDVSTK